MKCLHMLLATVVAASLCLLGTGTVLADYYPVDDWSPTEWGADDRAGAINRINPCTVMAALKLVKKGKTAVLGKIYQSDAPFFGVRGFNLTIPALPTGGPFPGGLIYNDEMVTTEIGQVGTQFDGPGHIGVRTEDGRDIFYNGQNLQEVGGAYGVGSLGVQNVASKAYVCRGVLLNAPKYRGMDMLPIPKGGNRTDPGNVNDDDIKGMVRAQGMREIGEADCVFIYTGWGNVWSPVGWDDYSAEEKQKRIVKFNSGAPGWGISGCRYLASRKIAMTGGDTWPNDAVPAERDGWPFECHPYLQTGLGIWNLENLQFVDLLADGTNEFLFVWSPLRIKGGTGSPGNPVAIW